MKGIAACLAALLVAAPAFAQTPRVPVPLTAAEGYGPCSTAQVINLEAPDSYLSVRAGPSRRERELGRLSNGQTVYACVRRGDWFGIIFEYGGRRDCEGVLEPRRTSGIYRGPCPSGWVHQRYLGGYADWISP